METFCLTDCIFVIFFVSFASKIYANIHLRILVNSIYHFHEKQLKQPLSCQEFLYLFRGNSSSKLNLIFIYFYLNHQFVVIDLIKFLILLHSSSYFLIFSLLSLVATSARYLGLLISSKYPFALLKIKYKGFTLLIFTYFESLIFRYLIC